MKTTGRRFGGGMIAAKLVRANGTVAAGAAVLFAFLLGSCATVPRDPHAGFAPGKSPPPAAQSAANSPCALSSAPVPALQSEEVCGARILDAGHIDVHGNVYLDQLPTGLLRRSFGSGDTVVATFLGTSHHLVFVTDIHDASPGTKVLHFHPENPPYVRMAQVNGAFAAVAGIAKSVHRKEGAPPVWEPADGVEFPIEVALGWEGRPRRSPEAVPIAGRSNRREDYPGLSDADFANFRPVSAPSMASGVLYRSSSPIDPSLGRSRYADAALSNACVKSVWNMADTADGAAAYPGSEHTCYRNHCTVRFATPLGTDFESGRFQAGVLGGLLFLSENAPPFLIHCKEGRDRTGVVAMLLEALCGASRAEMAADYLKSYENFARGGFDRKKAEDSFAYNLKALGLDGAPDAELRKRATEYLRKIGMEPYEVQALQDKLSRGLEAPSGQGGPGPSPVR